MRHRPWLAPVLAAGALAELAAFVVLAAVIGLGLTVLLVLLASLLGLVLLRREGLRAWRGFEQAVNAGQPPGRQVTDGVVGLGGALLLALPGLLTAVAGVLLLLPPTRWVLRGQLQHRAERRMSAAAAGDVFGPRRVRVHQDPPATGPDAEVVEGEIVDDPSQRG